jgi:hypothetical protein
MTGKRSIIISALGCVGAQFHHAFELSWWLGRKHAGTFIYRHHDMAACVCINASLRAGAAPMCAHRGPARMLEMSMVYSNLLSLIKKRDEVLPRQGEPIDS